MDLIHFIVFACIVYIAIVLGRMSAKNDMRRRFASIDEGIELPNVTAVINYILKLRDQVEKLEHDNQALQNSLNIARAAGEKLERDYKKLLEQLKEKRKECEEQEKSISLLRDSNKEVYARINRCSCKFDEWIQELWNYVSDINNNVMTHVSGLSEYGHAMDKTGKKYIYATELLNKSHLLTIGEVDVQKNGSLKYSEGSRSLGNYSSKENWAWLNSLNPLRLLPNMKPRESKPIAVITDYFDYKQLGMKYNGVFKTSTDIMNESVNMLDYMRKIKDQFPNILYNK